MNRVDYIDVLRGVAGLAGYDLAAGDLPGTEQRLLRDGVSRRLEMGWQEASWPELTVVEERLFAGLWASGTTYAASTAAAPVVVYYPPADGYFQSIRGTNLAQAPADASDVLNAAYWALAGNGFSEEAWVTGTVYAVGDRRQYAVDGLFYQCHTAHTAGGALVPTNASYWGLLVEWDRTVDYTQTGKTAIGTVWGVWDRHPDRVRNATECGFVLRAGGVVVLEPVTRCFVEFRKRCPQLFGEVYSATRTYAAGDQIYFGVANSATYRGNFYDCVTATAAGESPATTAAKWSVVEIPKFLGRYLEMGARADYLKSDGQGDKALVEEGQSQRELMRQVMIYRGQQGQRRTVSVGVR